MQALVMTKVSLPVKYLGVPLSLDYINAAQCLLLLQIITIKLESWDSNLLSSAGSA